MYVDQFPAEGVAIEAQTVLRQGGGSCANTMVQLYKLGNGAALCTVLGVDLEADIVEQDLFDNGVTTAFVLRGTQPTATKFTVQSARSNLTTISSKGGAGFDTSRISEKMLCGITHVHLDGTHMDAAIKLASVASELGVTISVHLTEVYPNVGELLKLADYVCTDDVFPQAMIGEISDNLELCMCTVFETYCPKAKLMMATLPTGGAVLLVGQNWSAEEHAQGPGKRCTPPRFPEGLFQRSQSLGYNWIGCKAWPALRSKAATVDGEEGQEGGAAANAGEEAYDPVAVGDVQVAGFIHGVLQSYPLPMSILHGAVCAGMSSRNRGTRAGPSKEELYTEFPALTMVRELQNESYLDS